MTTLTNIKFINSIIHWISDFPNSPLTATSIPIDLANPNVIYKTLVILLNENDFQPQIEHCDLFETEITQDVSCNIIKVHMDANQKIQEIENVLQRHFRNNSGKLKKIEGLRLIYSKINFYKLVIFQDIYLISKLCELLLKIGIYSSKLSTFGLTSIEFLSDQDKESIDEYYGKDFKEIEITSHSDTELDDLKNKRKLALHRIEDGKDFQFIDEPRKYVEEKNHHLRIINDLKEANKAYEKKYYDLVENRAVVFPTNEDFIDSIVWENDQFQKLIYSLLNI